MLLGGGGSALLIFFCDILIKVSLKKKNFPQSFQIEDEDYKDILKTILALLAFAFLIELWQIRECCKMYNSLNGSAYKGCGMVQHVQILEKIRMQNFWKGPVLLWILNAPPWIYFLLDCLDFVQRKKKRKNSRQGWKLCFVSLFSLCCIVVIIVKKLRSRKGSSPFL